MTGSEYRKWILDLLWQWQRFETNSERGSILMQVIKTIEDKKVVEQVDLTDEGD